MDTSFRLIDQINIEPNYATDRYIVFFDQGASGYSYDQVDNFGDLTLTHFRLSACFFKLPKGSFAVVHLYNRDFEKPEQPGEYYTQSFFEYQVYKSTTTFTFDERSNQGEESSECCGKPQSGDESQEEDAKEPNRDATTTDTTGKCNVSGGFCRGNATAAIKCPNPATWHAVCNTDGSLTCEPDEPGGG